MTVPLTPDQVRVLRDAHRAERAARLALERAKVAYLDAQEAKLVTIESLADLYKFDAGAALTLDEVAGILTVTAPPATP